MPSANRASRSTWRTGTSRTADRSFVLADCPGHVQYTRNTVTGASTADVVVLLVDARKGLLQQTRRHLAVAALLRVPHVVLAVNKIDLVGFDEQVFRDIAAEVDALAGDLGLDDVRAVPVSALDGDNVVDLLGAYPLVRRAVAARPARRAARGGRPDLGAVPAAGADGAAPSGGRSGRAVPRLPRLRGPDRLRRRARRRRGRRAAVGSAYDGDGHRRPHRAGGGAARARGGVRSRSRWRSASRTTSTSPGATWSHRSPTLPSLPRTSRPRSAGSPTDRSCRGRACW